MTDTAAKRHAAKIAQRLAAAYPEARCSLDFRSPLELLVATILSAQCTDVRVNQVTKTLFRKYPTAADYAKTDQEQLERDIQSTGFFRNKAKSIRECCRTLLEKYDGQVPKDMESLVQLPGVGRKTANVVLGTAYGIAVGVVVDTHVANLAPPGADRREGSRQNRARPDGAVRRKGLDRAQPRADPARPPLLHGQESKMPECPLESLCPKIGVAEESLVRRIAPRAIERPCGRPRPRANDRQ